MTCKDCTQAQAAKHWPIFQADCHGCQVRALASGPAYHTAMAANAMTPSYRSALQSLFGDGWRAAHEEVKAEHARIKGMA